MLKGEFIIKLRNGWTFEYCNKPYQGCIGFFQDHGFGPSKYAHTFVIEWR